jgi:hypothetical protein
MVLGPGRRALAPRRRRTSRHPTLKVMVWLACEAGLEDEADRWLRRAAAERDAWAMYELGRSMRGPDGEAGDEAMRWYERAAEAGIPIAMNNLAIQHIMQGQRPEAERWFETDGHARRERSDRGAVAPARQRSRRPDMPLSSRAHRRGSHCPSRLGQAAACTTLPMRARLLVRESSVIMDLSARPARSCMVAESCGTGAYMTVP